MEALGGSARAVGFFCGGIFISRLKLSFPPSGPLLGDLGQGLRFEGGFSLEAGVLPPLQLRLLPTVVPSL